MAGIDLGRFEVLTFDCYGTLIDWERGIARAFRAAAEGWPAEDDVLLERFAVHEAAAERGAYRSYREILASAIRGVAGDVEVELADEAAQRFSESVKDWPPFSDSTEALRRLGRRFKLGVITNCDDDLFARSNELLGVRFDWVITAERARSYKPSARNFQVALAIMPVPSDRILHVAQSLYHDHVPAKALGLSTAWIDRRRGRSGFGATPPAEAAPDFTFPSLAAFADAALA